MDETARLEARVWSRIMGTAPPGEPSRTADDLAAECAVLQFYRQLQRKFPKEGKRLVCLAKESIKYQKAMYFVETGRKYAAISPQILPYLDCRQAIRQRLLTLQKLPHPTKNQQLQQSILLHLLGRLL